MLPTCYISGRNEAGTDEAGRGCLAGDVYAAAVILPDDFHDPLLNDSKQLTEARRVRLRAIIEREAVAWAVAVATPDEIDTMNIRNASMLAMHRALDALAVTPGAVIVDGNWFRPWRDIAWQTFVKGDGRYANIAAASVLAKTHRDEYMMRMHEQWPMYHWDSNKGYPTRDHRAAIAQYGPSPIHRKSFRLLDSQLSLFD